MCEGNHTECKAHIIGHIKEWQEQLKQLKEHHSKRTDEGRSRLLNDIDKSIEVLDGLCDTWGDDFYPDCAGCPSAMDDEASLFYERDGVEFCLFKWETCFSYSLKREDAKHALKVTFKDGRIKVHLEDGGYEEYPEGTFDGLDDHLIGYGMSHEKVMEMFKPEWDSATVF